METQENVLYCICQLKDDNGLMIECIRGVGGCNGWVHPKCCGLILTNEEVESMPNCFVCPLCEKPNEKFDGVEAINTKLANEKVVKSRKILLEQNNGFKDDTIHSKRNTRSRRRSEKDKKKSYHVPESDEEIGDESESDSEMNKRLKKKKKVKKSNYDPNDNIDSDDGSSILTVKGSSTHNFNEGPVLVIDKILGFRKPEIQEDYQGVNRHQLKEYYVKWKGFSYMHSSWEQEETLINLDPIINKGKIRRFHEKAPQQLFITAEDDDGYFNPEYLEVHRIIAEKKETPINEDGETVRDDGIRYYIKWVSLPYSEATWERACDIIDDGAIKRFRLANTVPQKHEWKPLPHPQLREYKKMDKSCTYGVENNLKLREYQLEGLNWLVWNFYNRRSSILADEMGLGKTIQTLTFLDYLRSNKYTKCRGPFLVVAPLSLVQQWQNETETWTEMDCIVYHGNTESREIMKNYEFHFFDSSGRVDRSKPIKFNILVTTYEVAMKDIRLLQRIHWRCLIVDEAHRLKNHQSRLVEQLKGIRRDHCVLLTGTPLQNKTEELWALLNFLDPDAFPNISTFLEKFGNLQDSTQVADLHKLLKPYLLRRVKEDVEKSLPPKEETIIEVELTAVQKQWYRAIYERNTAFLYKGTNSNNAPNLMNVMMELRKCCNHPFLNNGVEESVCENLQTDAQRFEMLIKCCGKMVLIDKLLPRLKEGSHKVLIFSQMVRVLDILEDYLRQKGYLFERLDGGIRGNERQAAVNRFVKPEYKRFVMLLSTKAGGLGLNLTAADTVIIFDSDWNPQNDLQAQARAHRIGQTNSVKIYRLITRKTYEMHMFHRASLKLGLDRAVLTHMRQENENAGSSRRKSKLLKAQEASEIEELLKKGAYDVFREDDTAAEQFCAADIEQILMRSSQIVQYESEARGQFSKASFVSAQTSDTVDIDDPDFWKKAVGLEEPDPVIEEEMNVPLVRKRTRVSRFGELAESDEDDSLTMKDKNYDADGNNDEKEDKIKDLREWTVNGRERLQRALMHYGFGRWRIIRKQSGGSRELIEVETFARIFILHCGLCCKEPSSSSKEDSPFVKGIIQSAKSAEAHFFEEGGMIPPVLSDPDYVSRLKQGGARRVLIRLDVLFRLQRMVAYACDRLKLGKMKIDENNTVETENNVQESSKNDNEIVNIEQKDAQTMDSDKSNSTEIDKTPMDIDLKISEDDGIMDIDEKKDQNLDTNGNALHRENNNSVKQDTIIDKLVKVDQAVDEKEQNIKSDPINIADIDIDVRIKEIGMERVANAIDIPEIHERPSWTKITKWWDVEADRHLLMGVFLHGYGRCNQIMMDPRLCFYQRSHGIHEACKGKKVDTNENDSESVEREIITPEDVTHDESIEGDADIEDDVNEINEDDGGEVEKADDEPKDETVDKANDETSEGKILFKLPEVQQINRLLLWLLSTEDLKLRQNEEKQRRDRIQSERNRQIELEKQHKEAAMNRAEIKACELIQMDMFRHDTFLHNVSLTLGNKLPKPLREWTKEERRSLCYILSSLGCPEELSLPPSTPTTETEDFKDDMKDKKDIENNSVKLSESSKLTWKYIVKTAQLRKPPQRVARYVKEKFLPKCVKVSQIKIDRLPTYNYNHHQRLASGGIDYVDLTEKTASHGLKAKRLALLCLRRNKLLNALRWIKQNKNEDLLTYFQSEEARKAITDDLPVWWCPWIHDYGLIMGMIKYGISAWRRLRIDISLPFHLKNVQSLVQRIFLNGSAENPTQPPVAESIFSSDVHLSWWYQTVCNQFPSASFLENRVQNIAHHFTKDAPPDIQIAIPQPLDIFDTKLIDSSILEIPESKQVSKRRVDEIQKFEDFLNQTKEGREKFLSNSNTKHPLEECFNKEVKKSVNSNIDNSNVKIEDNTEKQEQNSMEIS